MRNTTFLATTDDELLRSLALLLLLEEGFVEAVVAPPEPRHIAAQQFLGAALQNGHIDLTRESSWMEQLRLASSADLQSISQSLVATGHLDTDQGLAFVGPTAELRYGRRNFMDLLAVFTAPPEVTVLHGNREIGSVDPTFLMTKTDRPRVLALAGRAWLVKHIDWKRRRAHVEPAGGRGRSQWVGQPRVYSHELAAAMRRVLLGATPSAVTLSMRAAERLDQLRLDLADRVDADRSVIEVSHDESQWWTFAGANANALLQSAIRSVAPAIVTDGLVSNLAVPLSASATQDEISNAIAECLRRYGESLDGVEVEVSANALKRLKFADLLPPELAARTLAARATDRTTASRVVRLPRLFTYDS